MLGQVLRNRYRDRTTPDPVRRPTKTRGNWLSFAAAGDYLRVVYSRHHRNTAYDISEK